MPSRPLALAALLAAFPIEGAARAETSVPPPVLRWLGADGSETWSVRLEPTPAGAPVTPLETSPSFRPLPAISLALLDGGTLGVEEMKGRVVLLDFWASWCAPCLQELPHLQKLYDRERPRGLAAVAINADEPVSVVKAAAARLGLSMPVGLYQDTLRETFGVRTLPTLILADRQGRIRARWDGYTEGLEKTIAARVAELLGNDPEGRARRIADVVDGAGSFEVAWALDLRAPVSGIATLPAGRIDGISVAVAAGDELALLQSDGSIARRLKLPSSSWRLAAPQEASPEGAADLLAFRAGSAEIVSIDLDQGMMRAWNAPGPVFDIVFRGVGAGNEARVWLATIEGLGVADLSGREVVRVGDSGSLVSAAPGPAGGGHVLASDGTIRPLDSSGVAGSKSVAPESARQLLGVPGIAGVGVAPDSVATRVAGAFLGGAGRQAALATFDGDLALVDLASGRIVFRATWPRVAALAAGDLDGDGSDELLVGAHRTVAALRARPPGTGAPASQGPGGKPSALRADPRSDMSPRTASAPVLRSLSSGIHPEATATAR